MLGQRGPDTAVIDAAPITDREREVLTFVAEGYSNKLISAELGISERTVKNHLTNDYDQAPRVGPHPRRCHRVPDGMARPLTASHAWRS